MIQKKLFAFLLSMLVVTASLLAQENLVGPERKYARPDIPGTFVLELGLNRPFDKPEKFELGLWGSRTVNIYYQYDMRILKSKFSFHPGIGLSLERFKFKNNYSLIQDGDSVRMESPASVGLSIKKSQLITNYVEIPLELRFSTNPEDPTRSFKISVGVRGGYLFDSFTKRKYKEDGDKVKEIDKRNFNLAKFRYGVYTKIGAGNFSVFAYYNLSPIFKAGEGPVFGNNGQTEMQNFTIGISLASF